MKKRQSSIELLRILAMLMIVAGHFLGQGGFLEAHADSLGAQLFGSGSRWAVNLFLIVGCWFMVDAPFRLERVARLYLTVLTYTVPLTLVAVCCGAHPSAKDLMRGFLPFTGRALWFASAYISLMLLTPWLKRAFELSWKSLGMLVGLLTVLIGGVCTLPAEQMCYTIDVCWFLYVYLAVGFLKLKCGAFVGRVLSRGGVRWACLAIGVASYVFLVLLQGRVGGFVGAWAEQCLVDIKTLPNFVSALLVFVFFLSWDLGSIEFVNRLARPAFAIYVIHQTPAFFPFLWDRICRVSEWQVSPWWGLYAAGIVLGVYAVGLVAEAIWVRWIEPLYKEYVHKVCERLTTT